MKRTITTSFHQPNNTDIPGDDAGNDNASNDPGPQRVTPTMYAPSTTPHPMGAAGQPQVTANQILGPTSQPLLMSRGPTTVTQQAPGSTQQNPMPPAAINLAGGNGRTELMLAARDGNLTVVQTLLSSGANVNAANSRGGTALMYATVHGKDDVAKVLINNGANINAADRTGKTALMYAARLGKDDVVKVLINNGANVNAADNRGLTVLMYAAGNGKDDVVKALINKGANVNATGISGGTALRYAAMGGYSTIVQTLLSVPQIDIDAKATDGLTALTIAAANGKHDVVKVLIDHRANVNTTDNADRTPLIYAAEKGDLNIVQALLSVPQIDIDAKASDGVTALSAAASNGKDDVVTALINKGANVNAINKSSCTPLMCAAEKGHLTTIRALLSAPQTDIHAKQINLQNALMVASYNGKHDVVKTLIDHGADVNTPYNEGWTLLTHAAAAGHLTTVQALLNAAPTGIHVKKFNLTMALVCAATFGKHDVVRLLIEHGANANAPQIDGWILLTYAVKHGALANVQALLGIPQIDIDAKNTNGSTTLMVATNDSKDDVVKALIDHGADVNITDKNDWTPLMCAAKKGDLRIVQALLSAPHININSKNTSGSTALMVAIENTRDEVVKALINKGANVNAADNKGWTPLLFAAQEGYLKIVQALLSAPEIDINARKPSVGTALMVAVDNGKDDVVKALIDYNANANIADKHGWTPLILAAKKGYLTITKTLLSAPNIDIDARKPDVGTALMVAADNGEDDIVKVLIDHGADVNITDDDNWTPLIWAAEQGYLPIVKTLLSAPQIDINAKRINGKTALYLPVICGDTRMVETLIEHGADINQVYEQIKALLNDPDDDSDGDSADDVEEMCVASLDFLKRYLSQRKAGVGNLNKEATWASAFSTSAVPPGPSQAASPSPEALALDTLIQQTQVQGPSLAQISFQAMRDQLLQKKLSATEVVRLIHTLSSSPVETALIQTLAIAIQLGAYHTKPEHDLIHHALRASRLIDEYEKSKFHLSPDNINRWQISGQTLLTRAAQAGDLMLVTALVDCGAALHLPDEHGNNALHAAVKAGAWSVCSYLLALGANPNTSDRSGISTLNYLAEAVAESDPETAILVESLITPLLAKGYRLNRF